MHLTEILSSLVQSLQSSMEKGTHIVVVMAREEDSQGLFLHHLNLVGLFFG